MRALLVADVDSLDPHQATRPSSWWFARALHRGLYAFPDAAGEEGGMPVPDLAEALPTFSDDGQTATIRLRTDPRFSNGRAVDAAAVRSSLRRLMAADVGIALHLQPRPGLPGGIERIDVVGDDVIRVRLRSPANDLVWLLAHPQASIVSLDTPRAPAAPARIAGAGPYRVTTYRPEQRIVLERNPAWDRSHDPVRDAWVDGIDARVGVDLAGAYDAIREGDADLILDPGPPDLLQPPVPEGARVERAPSSCSRYLFLDPSIRPLNRRRVRLAIGHALDRVAFVRGTGATAAHRLLPPTVTGSVDDVVLAGDIGRARALLEQEGQDDGFTIRMIVGDSERDRRDASRVRAALARASITVQISTVPPASLYPLYYADPSERIAMGIATWCADWPGLAGRSMLMPMADPMSLGEQRTPGRPGAGSTAAVAIRAALRAPASQAATRWAEADAAAIRTGLLIPLSWPAEQLVAASDLRGWHGSPMFPRGDPTALWLDAGGEG